MKKNLKWILLVVLIISLIITGILFINFNKDRNSNAIDDTEFSKILNKRWRRVGVSLYENGELISENFELSDLRYMFFTQDYVAYCNPPSEDCDEYTYIYEDGVITINSEDYFITKGTYDIVFEEESITLSQTLESVKIIHHLES